jgi:uncharacterized cupredoxin-like copper-binding protein
MFRGALWLFLLFVYPFLTYSTHGTFSKQVAVPDEDGVQRVYIKAGSYYFKPDYIIVKKGEPVELVLIRDSAIIPHNIVMNHPEAGMDFRIEIDPEEPVRVSFTPLKVGVFEFFCDKKLLFFPSHKEKGMHGFIEVLE